MKRTHLYTDHEVRLFDTILGLLEEACTSREEYAIGAPEEETESDVLVLQRDFGKDHPGEGAEKVFEIGLVGKLGGLAWLPRHGWHNIM